MKFCVSLVAFLLPLRSGGFSTPRAARARLPALRVAHVDVETSDEMRWYILQCFTGQEAWTALNLEQMLQRPEHAAAQARIEKALVPIELVPATRGKKVYHKERIVYPGYVQNPPRLGDMI